MREYAKMAAQALRFIHAIAIIAGMLVLAHILLFGEFGVEGTILEKFFQTGVVYDEKTDTLAPREINIYGLDIVGVYQPNYLTSSTSYDNFVTGESYSDVRLTYNGCNYHTGSALIFALGGTVIMLLMTLIFDNICHMLEKTDKDGKLFQRDIARLLHTTGIFLIEISAVCLITSLLANLLTQNGTININENFLAMGLFILCLSKYFDYGSKLEEEVGELV